MTLSDLSIKRPVFTTMVSLGVVVLGVMGFFRLGVNLFPDVQFPVVTVTTIYPGASPTEIETQVTKKLEDSLASIAGIKQIVSSSRDSVSHVVVIFELDVDVKEAAIDVRERVSQVRAQLPRETEEPTVSRLDIAASPIMTYTLSGHGDVQGLREYAQDVVKPQLEQVSGVLIEARAVTVEVRTTLRLFEALTEIGASPHGLLTEIVPLDDSLEAVFGYLIS